MRFNDFVSPTDGKLCLFYFIGLCVPYEGEPNSKEHIEKLYEIRENWREHKNKVKICKIRDRKECEEWTPIILNKNKGGRRT